MMEVIRTGVNNCVRGSLLAIIISLSAAASLMRLYENN